MLEDTHLKHKGIELQNQSQGKRHTCKYSSEESFINIKVNFN